MPPDESPGVQTPTPSPGGHTPTAQTPSATPAFPALTWGDDDCNNKVDSTDALKKLRAVAGMGYGQTLPCPGIGEAFPASAAGKTWGDTDCDSDIDSVDALAVLRFVAGFDALQTAGCPAVGESVGIGT